MKRVSKAIAGKSTAKSGSGSGEKIPAAEQRARILVAAEKVFATYGLPGSTLSLIAGEVGMSKQHLLYYFSSKEALYREVLQNVLNLWWSRMPQFDADPTRSAEQVLTEFVHVKFQLSRERPYASKLFAQEVISGGAISRELALHHPQGRVSKEVEAIEHWIATGQIAPVPPAHLLFILWATTQTYADFEAQMCSVLGRTALQTEDFEQGEALVMQLLRGGLGLGLGSAKQSLSRGRGPVVGSSNRPATQSCVECRRLLRFLLPMPILFAYLAALLAGAATVLAYAPFELFPLIFLGWAPCSCCCNKRALVVKHFGWVSHGVSGICSPVYAGSTLP